MNLNPVILAIPMYFTLMAVELIYESFTRKRTYRLNDAITNINTGVLNQLTNTFLHILKVGIYTIVYEAVAFNALPQNVWTFAAAFLMYDLCYYWSHRMAHEVSLFWGGHVVHHQSEDFNLSVALRQSSTAIFWGFPFYLPMALMGFHPTQFLLVGGFNLLYQFWIHTEHIDKLGWFEKIMNTPSHHRVHHGRDPKYIDKNYAGVFIIWDKIFGTFKAEEERPNYGITKPLNSWNPVYANFAHYIDLYHDVKKANTWSDRLKMMFFKPGWRPEYLGGYQAPNRISKDYQKYNADSGALAVNVYILLQFLASLGVTAYYLFNYKYFGNVEMVNMAIWIVLTTLMFGFLFEIRSNWVKYLEVARLLALTAGVAWFLGSALNPWVGLVLLFSIISIYAMYRVYSRLELSLQ